MTPARRLALTLAVLAAALAAVAALALFVGSAALSPRAVARALAGRADAESVESIVTLSLRLPRVLAAALAGGALAVAGVGFQGLTRNPLAEPSVLGVSSGAAFGVVVAQICGLGVSTLAALGVTAFAFAGAVLAAGAVWLIAAGGRGLSIQTLLLAGVIVGVFFSAAITVVISVVDFNRLGGVIHWLLGNLAPMPPASLAVFAGLAAAGFWLVVAEARALNLLALGEEAARQLGVRAERLKARIFAGAALLTASVVAFAGPIGFVGLIVPHALRMVLGPDHRLLVPASLGGGAIFLLLADTLARNIVAPAELSVGVITAFCGAPFFVWLLRTRYRASL
ncbi:MAG: iron ABC transporter permease [Candidatus Rokubacteria bacterium]|nr:iron ABC transporter permease [Candidatus Rokubacteria bacterium]MBI2157290.1 iron ABC transporter permease [Candidatus Rokubacteria bacterium]MBI2491988.1 iron ABC transporter permease [Candidatus Rokubacteria bacterium]